MAAHGTEPASTPFLQQTLPEASPVGSIRSDGRTFEEFRSVFMKTGVVSQASGSAYLEIGKTKVMAAVYGPRPTERREVFSQRGHVAVDVKVASFSSPIRSQMQQSPEEREMSAETATALASAVQTEAFPKAVVDVYVTVLEGDGGTTPACITAAALALADGGVPMNALVSACSLVRMEQGSLLVDPNAAEEAQAQAHAMLAAMPSSDLVTATQLSGQWTAQSATEAVAVTLAGCAQIQALMSETLIEAAMHAA